MFKPEQILAIELLLRGHSVSETARQIGRDKSTVSRWVRENDEFREAYEGGLKDLVADAARRFRVNADHAAETVVAIAKGEVEGRETGTRLTAALAILDRVGVTGSNAVADIDGPGDAATRIRAIYGLSSEDACARPSDAPSEPS